MSTPICHLCKTRPAIIEEDGLVHACLCCQQERADKNQSRSREARLPDWLQSSGIPRRYWTLKPDEIDHLDPDRGIYLFGDVGVGKTYRIANLMISEYLHGNQDSVFVTMSDLLDEIKAGFSDGSRPDPLRHYMEVEVLYLDDLGISQNTAWAVSIIDYLIAHRYNWMLRTVITSNFCLDDISRSIDMRVASRIAEMCVLVEMKGSDRRIKK